MVGLHSWPWHPTSLGSFLLHGRAAPRPSYVNLWPDFSKYQVWFGGSLATGSKYKPTGFLFLFYQVCVALPKFQKEAVERETVVDFNGVQSAPEAAYITALLSSDTLLFLVVSP